MKGRPSSAVTGGRATAQRSVLFLFFFSPSEASVSFCSEGFVHFYKCASFFLKENNSCIIQISK